MGITNPKNEQIKAIGMAIGASIIAAVTTMLVPNAVLEGLTGATGLSELVPATAAPLGDTARALIAFAAGTVTMILVLAYLLRKPPHAAMSSTNMSANNMSSVETGLSYDEQQDFGASGLSLLQRCKAKIANFQMPNSFKMPWSRDSNSNDIFDLSDLPQLRAQDAHPDSPARKPISALLDLDEAGLVGTPAPLPSVAEHLCVPEQTVAENCAFEPEPDIETTTRYGDVAETAAVSNEAQSTLSELVAQLEAAVENRKAQLAALEVVAAQLASDASLTEAILMPAATLSWPPEHSQPKQSQPMLVADETIEPTYMQPLKRPSLEMVPNVARTQNDAEMDAALNAALATLQRMNVK